MGKGYDTGAYVGLREVFRVSRVTVLHPTNNDQGRLNPTPASKLFTVSDNDANNTFPPHNPESLNKYIVNPQYSHGGGDNPARSKAWLEAKLNNPKGFLALNVGKFKLKFVEV